MRRTATAACHLALTLQCRAGDKDPIVQSTDRKHTQRNGSAPRPQGMPHSRVTRAHDGRLSNRLELAGWGGRGCTGCTGCGGRAPNLEPAQATQSGQRPGGRLPAPPNQPQHSESCCPFKICWGANVLMCFPRICAPPGRPLGSGCHSISSRQLAARPRASRPGSRCRASPRWPRLTRGGPAAHGGTHSKFLKI